MTVLKGNCNWKLATVSVVALFLSVVVELRQDAGRPDGKGHD